MLCIIISTDVSPEASVELLIHMIYFQIKKQGLS